MDAIQLERFTLKRPLGIGANYEVHAAIDSQTGREVVLKRPWAQFLSRGQYQHVDNLSARLIEVHRALGDALPYVSHLIGYTDCTQHDAYFGDLLPQKYHVLVEERARGVPLVASARDKFIGVPIGLVQNLFTLYPLVSRADKTSPGILQQLLDVEEAFYNAGFLVLDMRPQNVFFDPKEGRITVIDIGGFLASGTGRGKNGGPDLHDAFAELCKFYLTPHSPPAHVNGYRDPFGMGPDLGFRKELDRMLQSFLGITTPPLQEAAVAILRKVKERGYGTVGEFRGDLQQVLALVSERNSTLPDVPSLVRVWREGMEMLKDKYWRKFLFDPDADLIHYL
ncbi:MAG: serine/threonine protein kinase [Nitrospinae bacterium]|nr:serine/threonine protein kinase [Nitrospinota bacterium]